MVYLGGDPWKPWWGCGDLREEGGQCQGYTQGSLVETLPLWAIPPGGVGRGWRQSQGNGLLPCQSVAEGASSLECSFPAPPACHRWAEPAGEGQVLATGIGSVGGEMGGALAAKTSP